MLISPTLYNFKGYPQNTLFSTYLNLSRQQLQNKKAMGFDSFSFQNSQRINFAGTRTATASLLDKFRVPYGAMRRNPERDRQFREYLKRADYPQRLVALLRGLPRRDQQLVKTIIERLTTRKPFFYTPQERALIARMRTFRAAQTDPLRAGGYRFKERIDYEAPIFIEKMGLGAVKNPGYFKHKDILDVGAYRGDSALVLSEYTTGHVHCFEPDPRNGKRLEENIALNRKKGKIIPVQLGLSDRAETIPLLVDPLRPTTSSCTAEGSCHSSILKTKKTIRTVKLDDYVKKHGLNVGLIKIDVEGFEQNVLRGAKETLERDKPVLLVSIYHNVRDFFEIKPQLEAFGYTHFRIVKTDYGSPIAETMLICEP